MLGVFLVGELDSEVVNNEAEGDGSCRVVPQSGCVLALAAAVLRKALGKEFVGDYPGLR